MSNSILWCVLSKRTERASCSLATAFFDGALNRRGLVHLSRNLAWIVGGPRGAKDWISGDDGSSTTPWLGAHSASPTPSPISGLRVSVPKPTATGSQHTFQIFRQGRTLKDNRFHVLACCYKARSILSEEVGYVKCFETR